MNKRSKVLLLTIIGIMQINPFVLNAEDITSFVTDKESKDVTTEEVTSDEATTEATKEAMTDEATTEAMTDEATTEAMTDEVTTKEVATDEVTTDEATTETTDEATTETTDEVTTETTDEATTEEVTTDEATTETTDEATTEEASTKEATTETTDEATTEEASTKEAMANDVTISLEKAVVKQSANVYKSSTLVNTKVDLSKNTADTNKREAVGAGEQKINVATNEATIISDERAATKGNNNVKVDIKGLKSTDSLYAKSVKDVSQAVKNVEDNQLVVDKSGDIIAAGESSFMTIGGVDHISYLYGTPSDAKNRKSEIPLNGGGQLGRYLDTVEYNDEYYAHVEIGGTRGYMLLDEIQILPSEFNLPEAYYEVRNGSWTKVVPVDPLTSNETITYTVGSAPSFAKSGVKYYSTDDETYYLNEIGESRGDTAVATGAAYFQNLPLRSTTAYTGDDLKNYMMYMSSSHNRPDIANSQYINATDAFIKAQEYYGVNGLLLFAFANHESSYGTSTQAKQCNNFFGRGAVDSDPGNGCVVAHFENPADGILAQAGFLTQFYTDVADWRYYGTNPGNKQSGLNAKYASDANWGAGISSMMYRVDQYLGGHEEGKFRIVKLASTQKVYKDSSLTNQYTLSGQEDASSYQINQKVNTWVEYNGTTPVATITENPSEARFIVTSETNDAMQVQLPTAIADKTGYIPFSFSSWGEYPYFEGVDSYPYGNANQTYPNYVYAGTGNSFDPYSSNDDWARNRGWIDKNIDGSATYEVVNDVSPLAPTGSKPTDITNPILYTTLETANFTSADKLNLEGAGYLKGINSEKHSDIKHELVMIDDNTKETIKRYDMGNVINPEAMNQYENDGYQYDSGYFASPGYAGVDLSELTPGTYDVYLYAESSKNPDANDEEQIYVKDSLSSVQLKSKGKYKYTLYAKNNGLMLKVENAIDDVTNPELKTNLTKANFTTADKLNVEGVGYLKGISSKDHTDIKHTLQVVDDNSKAITKEYDLGNDLKPEIMDKYETDGRQYDAGYFATQGYNGVDLSELTPGTYDMYLYAESAKNPKANDREQIYVKNSLETVELKSKGKYNYTVYAKDNKLMLKVENRIVDVTNPELKTNLTKANFTTADKLNVEGVGYLKGISSKDHTDIKHTLQVVDDNSKAITKEYDLGNDLKPEIMDKYETDGRQYDAGYFATQGYNGVDLSELTPGTYDMYLYAESAKNPKANDREQIYVKNSLETVELKSKGKYNYTVYAKDNKLMLKVENRIVDVTNPELKTSVLKAKFTANNMLDIEGVGYLKGINTPKTTDIQHKLKFVNMATNTVTKTYNIGADTRAATMDKYETDGRQYDGAYFATYNFAGVDVSVLPVGSYKIRLYAQSTKNPSANDEEDLYVASKYNSTTLMQSANKFYYLHVKNNNLILDVYPKNETTTNLRTSVKNAWLKNNKLHVEGVGFIDQVNVPVSEAVTNKLVFKNYETNATVKSFAISAKVNHSALANYETNGYNYDAGYFTTYKDGGIDISSLPKGKYKVYLEQKSNTINKTDSESLYSKSIKNETYNSSYNGKNYKLYTVNNRLVLEIS